MLCFLAVLAVKVSQSPNETKISYAYWERAWLGGKGF